MSTTVTMQDHLIGALRSGSLTRQPWPHGYLAETLPRDVALRLSRSFDTLSLTPCEETEREKTYRFRTARLYGLAADGPPIADWATMVAALTAPAYRQAMSGLTDVALEHAELTIDLWEYQTGDWLAPHVDKPDKLVTQIFYLTQIWRPDDGGRLLILRSARSSTVARALAPMLGASAVLVRSEHSWHAVEPPGPHSAPRRSLTATFWAPNPER